MAGTIIITKTKYNTYLFRLINEEGIVDRIEVSNYIYAGKDEDFEQQEYEKCKKYMEEQK